VTPAKKKKVAVGVGLGLLLWAAWARASGRGRVLIGPVTVTNVKLDLDAETDAMAKRAALALPEANRMMGKDPNTGVSRNPSPAEQAYIRELIELNRQLSHRTTWVPYPTLLEQMLAASLKLPGDALQQTNTELYALLGVNPNGDNMPTLPLTPAGEARARELIARWRPYNQLAVDTLFVLVDEARDLGGNA
jgi:hypothetical protein